MKTRIKNLFLVPAYMGFFLLTHIVNAQQQVPDACWSGTWIGTYSFTTTSCNLTDSGTITLTLSVSNGIVSGSGIEDGILCYDETTCEITGSGTFSGPVSGTVSGTSISLSGNWVNSCNGQTYGTSFGGALSGCTITGGPSLTLQKQGGCDACRTTPTITWNNPAAIIYGTPLSSAQLNATANVAGGFAYSPPNGTVLNVGTNTLSVIFTPTDTVDYTTATDTVSLVVLPATIVGSVVKIVGKVTVTRLDGSHSTLKVGDPLYQGDVVETSKSGAVNITFADNTTFAVSESARMSIDQFVYHAADHSGSGFFNLLQGLFVYTSGLIGKTDPGSVNMETPVGAIGTRGTQFITGYDPCSSTQTVYLIEGELAITPLNTPGVTNLCYAPVTIFMTPDSVTTNMLTQAMYDSISNQLLQAIGTFPAWQEQYFGCTNDPDAAPTADPSGDGEDNYSKFLTGMNPTNAASYFHILSATNAGNDEMVSWMCGGGTTNVLQATTNLGGTWSNVSPNIVLAGDGDSVTNYLDAGAVANTPARFYRVLLVQ